jgi:cytochrome c-type biogenesis protein CcmH/NrfG
VSGNIGFYIDMNCLNCGEKIRSGDQFCASCGWPAGKQPASTGSFRKDHLIIITILAVVVIAYYVFWALRPEKSAVESQPQQQQRGASQMPMDVEAFRKNLPTEFASLVSMGNALMDEGRYELAIMCYRQALEQKPEDVNVRVDLGTCQHALGMNQDAIDNFKEALRLDPTHQIAKFNLGIVYYSAGEYKMAADSWNRLLSENPSPELRERTEELLQQVQAEY